MNIVHLFNRYFFVLMIIQGIFLTFIDYKRFKKNKLKKSALQSRTIGILFLIFSTLLCFLSIYYF
ncbi:CLC_0170 family protein [Clostridium luticellarii]|uniref:CLC_0170 family protein n=1 Tax=Clostridium luticellarii TaxID=1691940 RepID=UPI000D0363B5